MVCLSLICGLLLFLVVYLSWAYTQLRYVTRESWKDLEQEYMNLRDQYFAYVMDNPRRVNLEQLKQDIADLL